MPKPEAVHEKNILTPRELEVLKAIKNGHTANKEIANELSIEPGTARNHLKNIYGKLGISGEASSKKFNALIKAISLGKIEPFQPSIDQENTPLFQLGAESLIASFINSIALKDGETFNRNQKVIKGDWNIEHITDYKAAAINKKLSLFCKVYSPGSRDYADRVSRAFKRIESENFDPYPVLQPISRCEKAFLFTLGKPSGFLNKLKFYRDYPEQLELLEDIAESERLIISGRIDLVTINDNRFIVDLFDDNDFNIRDD